jgi:hypothetical protein
VHSIDCIYAGDLAKRVWSRAKFAAFQLFSLHLTAQFERMLCLLVLRNSRLEQLLIVASAIPMFISGWREIIYMLGYSCVRILFMKPLRNLLPPLLALLVAPHACL